MQEATLSILDLPIVGLTLEEKEEGLSELTIDLQMAVSADALSKLLGSLAELYRIGYAAAGKPEAGDVVFGKSIKSQEWYPPDQLFITKLEIGTPNKVKVTGVSAVLDDIYKIMKILTLAVALFTVPSSMGHGEGTAGATQTQSVEQSVTINPPNQPPYSVSVTVLDLNRALNENIAIMANLERQLANGEIPLHFYLEQRARYETINQALMEDLKVTKTRSATS